MEIFKSKFWTMERRAWLYACLVALSPLLMYIKGFTPDLTAQILEACAVILAVSGGTMALTNLTPNNVVKIGVEVPKDE